MAGVDILVVAVPGTGGWRTATDELVAALESAGARVASAATARPRELRTFALTDLAQAWAARRACERALARSGGEVGAVIYCSITAALLWPRPGAIWLDAVAGENRPGRHGIWQRPVERRRLAQAPLVLPWSPRALQGAPGFTGPSVVVPPPVEGSGPGGPRDIAAVTYAGNPEKKRLAHVLEAWSRARRGDERLVVAGADGLPARRGVELAGDLPPDEYRALLRRTRVFVAAPAREDFGIAPLEALAHGCLLVTTPAPGAYPALDLARALDSRLVAEDLTRAVRTALDDPLPGYAEQAAGLLAPYSRAAVRRTVGEEVLPRILPRWRLT